MKYMIDITEEVYDEILSEIEHAEIAGVGLSDFSIALKNGTPLPKGYGDLVDRDEINSRFNAICDELESLSNKPSYKELLDKFSMCLDTGQTIIEADK